MIKTMLKAKKGFNCYVIPLTAIDPMGLEGILNGLHEKAQVNIEGRIHPEFKHFNGEVVQTYINSLLKPELCELYKRNDRFENVRVAKYKCSICNIICKGKTSMRIHVDRFHKPKKQTLEKGWANEYMINIDPDIDESGMCKICKANFSNFESYLTHLRKYHPKNMMDKMKNFIQK